MNYETFITFFVSILVTLMFFVVGVVEGEANVTLEFGGLEPSSTNIILLPNDTISVEIIPGSFGNSLIQGVRLNYNPDVVIVQNISEVDISGIVSDNYTEIDNTIGETTIVSRSDYPIKGNVSDSITFAKVLFKAVGRISNTTKLNSSLFLFYCQPITDEERLKYNISDPNFTCQPMSLIIPGKSITFAIGLKGDVNGDGVLNIIDALFMAQYSVGIKSFSIFELAVADINNDNKVAIDDALYIAQCTVGLRKC